TGSPVVRVSPSEAVFPRASCAMPSGYTTARIHRCCARSEGYAVCGNASGLAINRLLRDIGGSRHHVRFVKATLPVRPSRNARVTMAVLGNRAVIGWGGRIGGNAGAVVGLAAARRTVILHGARLKRASSGTGGPLLS